MWTIEVRNPVLVRPDIKSRRQGPTNREFHTPSAIGTHKDKSLNAPSLKLLYCRGKKAGLNCNRTRRQTFGFRTIELVPSFVTILRMKKKFITPILLALVFSAFNSFANQRELHLLLLSNTQNEGSGPLDHAIPAINKWRGNIDSILFVPFASKDEKASTEKARGRLAKEGLKVVAMTADEAGRKNLETAKAIYVGGGNTFRLLDTLQKNGFLEPLRRRILEGVPYLGSSAGANIISPTIKTTNDMPIVAPASFNALDILPFQINVHFFDPIKGMPGETRQDRLFEFFQDNDVPVLAMRQGSWVTVNGKIIASGGAGIRILRPGDKPFDQSKPNENKPREFKPGSKFNFQLEPIE